MRVRGGLTAGDRPWARRAAAACALVAALGSAAAGAAPARAMTVDSPWRGWQTVGPPPSLRGEATIDDDGGTVAIRLHDRPDRAVLLVRDARRWRHVVAPFPRGLVGTRETPSSDPSASVPPIPGSTVAVPAPRTVLLQRGCALTRSADLGTTWTSTALPRCTPGEYPGTFRFADGRRGLVNVDGLAWATADGGRSWRGPVAADEKLSVLGVRRDFRIADGSAGGPRELQVTHDSGTTWTAVSLPHGAALGSFWAFGTSGATGVFLATERGRYVSDDDGATFTDAPGADRWSPPNAGDGSWSSNAVRCDRGVCTVTVDGTGKGGSITASESWTIPAWVARGDTAPPARPQFTLSRTVEGDFHDYEDPTFDRLWGCPANRPDYDDEPMALSSGTDDDPGLGGATTPGGIGRSGLTALLAGDRLWIQRAGRWSAVPAPARGCVQAVVARGRTLVALVSDGQEYPELRVVVRRPGARWRTLSAVDDTAADLAVTPTGPLLPIPGGVNLTGGVDRLVGRRQRTATTAPGSSGGFARIDAHGRVVLAWGRSTPQVSADGGRTWRRVRGLHAPSDVQILDRRHLVAVQSGRLLSSSDGGRRWHDTSRIGPADVTGTHGIAFRDRRVGVVVRGGRARLTVDAGRSWRAVELPFASRVSMAWIRRHDLYLQDADSGDVWRHRNAVSR
ncbi:hypothetical protein AB0L40_09895 [Patulibacter sp. NPDC049589]|uniref:hypothetical protein n=1 Tax=Patulibacter sp. NPDC049589 TaxID=3154731 RepID=UPI0034125939